MKKLVGYIVVPGAILGAVGLAGCGGSSSVPADIYDQSTRSVVVKSYTVLKGDTLYSIAWSAGVDWNALADWNGLRDPYLIHPGQKLRIRSGARRTTTATGQATPSVSTAVSAPAPAPAPAPTPTKTARVAPPGNWQWPVRGQVTQRFAAAQGHNGIDIRATPGTPVTASASGHVVYAGDGLSGYGNLVIIKHNDTYLSAYGHNHKINVREGQRVQQGEALGVTASGGSKAGLMHFQLRKQGKPVDPLRYLPAR